MPFPFISVGWVAVGDHGDVHDTILNMASPLWIHTRYGSGQAGAWKGTAIYTREARLTELVEQLITLAS
jgi:hypothetical protein